MRLGLGSGQLQGHKSRSNSVLNTIPPFNFTHVRSTPARAAQPQRQEHAWSSSFMDERHRQPRDNMRAQCTGGAPAAASEYSEELLKSNGSGSPAETSNSSGASSFDEVQEALQDYGIEPKDWTECGLTVVVVGASGDLARKKIFPALFALYHEGMLPKHFSIVGYSRSKMTDEEFKDLISENLTCRVTAGTDCGTEMEEYLSSCVYVSGQYDSEGDFGKLDKRLSQLEKGRKQADRIFYLSIPPAIFTDVAACASKAATSKTGWTRVIVEKPFGRDSRSFNELSKALYEHLTEEQMYRIDHYLGKELIENLTVLRFANLMFEPLWNRTYIRNVQVIFSENFGTEGRGGYFDQYGIIRDVIQNHLLQILTLFAMEPPVSLDAEDIRNEKVKVLRSMKQVEMSDVVVGQYRGRGTGKNRQPGYLEDKTVPAGSLCPTFSAIAMHINNARWDGVPFLLKAGKAMHSKRAEIRVQFRHVPGNLYKSKMGADLDAATNELVIRIQPNESIYLKINNKVPGLGLSLDTQRLDLCYDKTYKAQLPDAYERLILDVINGDKRLFIRNDELEAAWALFTPILDELESSGTMPELYPYGSRGPVGAHYLAAKYGVRWGDVNGDEEDD